MAANAILHPNIRLGEVKLKVRNLEQQVQFYVETVGLKLLRQALGVAELGVGTGEVLLILEEDTQARLAPRRSRVGLYHFAILLPTRQALGITLQHLDDAGIHIGQADHLVSEALYISDPEGNGIEIYRDRPRAEWRKDAAGNYVMATEPIDWHGLLREAQGKEWAGLPDGTVMGHVHLHVNNLQAARVFYCDTVGFEPTADLAQQMGALFIAAGGYHHHLGLNIWAGTDAPKLEPDTAGLMYYTLLLPSEAELAALLSRAEAAGAAAVERDGSWYITDPFGIQLRAAVVS